MVRRRRAVRALALLAVLLIGLTVIALVVSQTPWFRERVRRLAMRQAQQVVDGTLVIGAVEGNFASGITLRDVELRQGETTVVRVARVELAYSIGDVLSSARVVRRITVRPLEGNESLEAIVFDGTGEVTVTWMGRRAIRGLSLGTRLVVLGESAHCPHEEAPERVNQLIAEAMAG